MAVLTSPRPRGTPEVARLFGRILRGSSPRPRGTRDALMSAVNTSGRERPAAPLRAVAVLLAHGWERGLMDVGDKL